MSEKGNVDSSKGYGGGTASAGGQGKSNDADDEQAELMEDLFTKRKELEAAQNAIATAGETKSSYDIATSSSSEGEDPMLATKHTIKEEAANIQGVADGTLVRPGAYPSASGHSKNDTDRKSAAVVPEKTLKDDLTRVSVSHESAANGGDNKTAGADADMVSVYEMHMQGTGNPSGNREPGAFQVNNPTGDNPPATQLQSTDSQDAFRMWNQLPTSAEGTGNNTATPGAAPLQRSQNVPTANREPGAYPADGPEAEEIRTNNPEASIMWNMGNFPDSTQQDDGIALFGDIHENQEEGLVTARPVPDQTNLTLAQEVDSAEVERRSSLGKQQQQNWQLWMGILFMVCLIVAISVGVGLGTRNNDENSSKVPLYSASIGPSTEVSVAPAGAMDQLLLVLPDDTIARMNNGSDTPQWKAWNWLSNHGNLTYLPDWRKVQLFALATFFYAFEGDKWFKPIRERWMDDTKDECEWFSGRYGNFDSKTGQYVDVSEGLDYYYAYDVCDDDGVFQLLLLHTLNLQGATPTVPPEIGLLTSLRDFSCWNCELESPLSSIVPTDLQHMPNLTDLYFRGNQIMGTIPSELGLFTRLTTLILDLNVLSGSIPSEVGLVKPIEHMGITENSISGSLPTQFGILTNLAGLYFQNNMISGPLPSEIGLLTGLLSAQLENNLLSGSLPSEIALLSSINIVRLQNNSLTGNLPSELGVLPEVNQMLLMDNDFTGQLPLELCRYYCMEKTNPFPGDQFLGEGSSVNVSAGYCGCVAGKTYPLPNATHEVVVNVQFDGWPEATSWGMEVFHAGNQTWEEIAAATGGPDDGWQLTSTHIASLLSSTLYRFYVTDLWANGICCGGAVSVTNGTMPDALVGTSYQGFQGTILWLAPSFTAMTDVHLWVDVNGFVSVVTEEEGKRWFH